MATLYDYLKLDNNQRAELLWKHSTFLTNTTIKTDSFALYSLYGFYVEVLLDGEQIKEITPFKQGGRFDKYLDVIDISELGNRPSN